MSNLNSINYKQKLDGVLRNCRLGLQQPRQSSQENSIQPTSCKSKPPAVRSPINITQPQSTQNKSPWKPNLFKSTQIKVIQDLKEQRDYSTKENIALNSRSLEKDVKDQKENQLTTTITVPIHSRTQTLSTSIGSVTSIGQQVLGDSTKAQKLCDLLDQLIKTADDDRKILQVSANLNMPLQQNPVIQAKYDEIAQRRSIETISYSDDEDLKESNDPQDSIMLLKHQVEQYKIQISKKDIQINNLSDQNAQLRTQNSLLQKQSQSSDLDKYNEQLRVELRNQQECYEKKLEEIDRERNCLEEVLKNFLLKRELDKLRGPSVSMENSMQFSSICLDQKQQFGSFNSNDLMKYVESKNISKGQMMFLLPNDAPYPQNSNLKESVISVPKEK